MFEPFVSGKPEGKGLGLPLVEKLAPALKSIRTYALLTDREHMPPKSALPGLLCYEGLLAEMSPAFEWPEFDEHAACAAVASLLVDEPRRARMGRLAREETVQRYSMPRLERQLRQFYAGLV